MTVIAQMLTDSALNRLPREVLRQIRFWAPLLYSLDIWGVEPVTFTRPSSQSATWRDGAAHTVGNNVPRFEYSGEDNLGLLFDAALTEVLQFSSQNALDDSKTLIWIEEGSPKQTPLDSNPINASGQWIGSNQVHIRHIVKGTRDRDLTASERAEIINALMGALTYNPDGSVIRSESIAQGATTHVINHSLLNPMAIVTMAADWPTDFEITARDKNSRTVRFSDPAPAGGGVLDWGAEI